MDKVGMVHSPTLPVTPDHPTGPRKLFDDTDTWTLTRNRSPAWRRHPGGGVNADGI